MDGTENHFSADSHIFQWVLWFMGHASTFFRKNNFKTRSHGTIHTFKNYFVTVFSVFSNKRYSNTPYIREGDDEIYSH